MAHRTKVQFPDRLARVGIDSGRSQRGWLVLTGPVHRSSTVPAAAASSLPTCQAGAIARSRVLLDPVLVDGDSCSNEVVAMGEGDGCRPGLEIELRQDAGDMRLDCPQTDEQGVRNLLV